MDKIFLNQLQFYGYHGLFQEEKKLGQRFMVDVVLHVSLKEAGITDDMEKSIDYGTAYSVVQEIVEGDSRNLIESIAEQIATSLLQKFALLEAVSIKLIKPDPPIPGQYESVAVEIFRDRG